MLTYHLALVDQTGSAPAPSLVEAAAAIQRQITRDFAPVWRVSASVQPFDRLEQVPVGHWPIVLRHDLRDPTAVGMHLDDNGQPLALVQATNVWSLSASHEAVEMLADPYGNRLIPGGSLRPGQGVVEYLVEVADPVAGIENGYSVNGVLVSDFVTPEYYQHPAPVPGTSYSFTGAITRPRDVIAGGYVAWREPLSGEWWQAGRVGGELRFAHLGTIDGGSLALRSSVDSYTLPPHFFAGVDESNPHLLAARARFRDESAASAARAEAWHRKIGTLVRQPQPAQGKPTKPNGDGNPDMQETLAGVERATDERREVPTNVR